MNQIAPYHQLNRRRTVNRDDLPADFREWYSRHEGCGLEADPDRSVRLCRLSEAQVIGWGDIRMNGGNDLPRSDPSYDFRAVRVGVGSFFDDIVYILRDEFYPPCSVVAYGNDVAGPDTEGAKGLPCALVLGKGFAEWLRHLEKCRWVEYGLTPGEIGKRPAAEQVELRRYYRQLNPGVSWAEKK